MKIRFLVILWALFSGAQVRAEQTSKPFTIDFLCCGEYINIWDAAYSNAVLKAVFPHFKTFARKLGVPPPKMDQIKRFMPHHLKGGFIDQVGGGLELNDRTVFGFNDGQVTLYEGPSRYFGLADFRDVPVYFGAVNLTKEKAIELARETITKLGHSLEDVFADLEPEVAPLETSNNGTNVVPRYRIKWIDPRSGAKRTEIEVNGEAKRVESIRFSGIIALKQPGPKLKIEPTPLPLGHQWRRANALSQNTNPEYAYRLVPVVFQAVEEWARKLNLNLPLPLTSNQVERFYCETSGGVPFVKLSLTNKWEFIYRMSDITYAASPRCFFDSDHLPFRLKNYSGQSRLTEEQAIELARQTIAKLGYKSDITHTDEKPRLWRPKEIKGMPIIPRLQLEWIYPNPQAPRSVWIKIEIDCDKGTVESLQFDVTELWKKAPDLGVPMDNVPMNPPDSVK